MIGICNFSGESKKGNKIPSIYQECEYITIQNNSANGYYNGICTGISFSNLIGCTIYGELRSTDTASNFMFVCGTSQVAYNNSGSQWIGWSGNATSLTISSITGTQTLACTRAEICSNIKKSVAVKITALSSNTGYLLNFGMWDSSNASEWSRTASWYKMQVFNSSDQLIFNGVPCYNKSTKVVGIYDTISDSFLTSKGAGVFTAGPDI